MKYRYFHVFEGDILLRGTLRIPADSRDVLADAEREANRRFKFWTRIDEV